MSGLTRTRAITMGALLLIIAVIGAAFALGGNGNPVASHDRSAYAVNGEVGVAVAPGTTPVPTPVASPPALLDTTGSAASTKSVANSAGGVSDAVTGSGSSRGNEGVAASSGVAATRVVKTGTLSLTVHKGLVATTITRLTTAATSLGGYVAESHTDNVNNSPTGSVTLRIPIAHFEAAISNATGLGHETSLNTNAEDVTGKFVDTNARLSALKRTRATYLTILSRARTIGQTLSVQQRVNDIQQQIESLQGELKVLRNQSSDGTLTVSVSEAGSVIATTVHHPRSGFSKAWHTSTSRFNRGIQSIIGGLGPLLLALILLAIVYVIGRLGIRRINRATT